MVIPPFLAPNPNAPLDRAIAARERRPNIEKRQENGGSVFSFSSGTWQGGRWNHRILYRVPAGADEKTAILYVTGDGPKDGDFRDIELLSNATGMPVAMLFDVPNQPIEGRREDDLIAHSFAKFLETGDDSWPLLLPMTRAAVSAMDVLERETPARRFVVTGASKRGWTTWLAGATGDRRIAGIAPMVFDNLDFRKQLPRQLELWGKYSAMIEDYTRRGLQSQLETPRGRKLQRIVDPISYAPRLTMPKLVVIGANDPYWPTDGFTLYKDGLKGPLALSVTPNAGHDLGPKIPAILAVGAFARSLAGKFAFPQPRITESFSPTYRLTVRAGRGLKKTRLWIAQSETTDFRESKWTPGPESTPGPNFTFTLPKSDLNQAVYAELVYDLDTKPFSLATPVRVIKK